MDNPLVSALSSGWLLPPLNALVLLVAGLLVSRWRRRTGLALLAAGTVLLYASSAPFVAVASIRALEVPPNAQPADSGAQAIVVLGSGSYIGAPEYGRDVPAAGGLERVRYAAFLQRATGLPVLVTGGAVFGAQIPEAEQMRAVLEEELRTPVRWVEPTGKTTWASALATRVVLRGEGIERVLLVTHAWHMRRARFAFEQAGMTIIPAPTAFTTYASAHPPGLMPTAEAMQLTRHAWREVIGIGWYRVRAALAAPAGR
jgi:uncharacterized SAM-binding protein YcdF (DUF218 family)